MVLSLSVVVREAEEGVVFRGVPLGVDVEGGAKVGRGLGAMQHRLPPWHHTLTPPTPKLPGRQTFLHVPPNHWQSAKICSRVDFCYLT